MELIIVQNRDVYFTRKIIAMWGLAPNGEGIPNLDGE